MKQILFIALLLLATIRIVGQVQNVDSLVNVSLTVQDDGCGFDEKTFVKGDGLQNIRNRIASCRGKLDIASSPGNGTETVIELRVEPLNS
jgi:signal transduction histidine kinase